jgi:hypothetical protein
MLDLTYIVEILANDRRNSMPIRSAKSIQIASKSEPDRKAEADKQGWAQTSVRSPSPNMVQPATVQVRPPHPIVQTVNPVPQSPIIPFSPMIFDQVKNIWKMSV